MRLEQILVSSNCFHTEHVSRHRCFAPVIWSIPPSHKFWQGALFGWLRRLSTLNFVTCFRWVDLWTINSWLMPGSISFSPPNFCDDNNKRIRTFNNLQDWSQITSLRVQLNMSSTTDQTSLFVAHGENTPEEYAKTQPSDPGRTFTPYSLPFLIISRLRQVAQVRAAYSQGAATKCTLSRWGLCIRDAIANLTSLSE